MRKLFLDVSCVLVSVVSSVALNDAMVESYDVESADGV